MGSLTRAYFCKRLTLLRLLFRVPHPEVVAYESFDCFDTLTSIVDKHAPIKQVSRNKERLFKKPWISRGILKSIKIKHTMRKTHFSLSKDPAKVNEFKKYSNRLNYLKSTSKKAYFCTHFDLCKGNLNAACAWKLIAILIIKGSFELPHGM